MSDLRRMDATGLLVAFRDGRTTPSTVLDELLEAIEAEDAALNCFATLNPGARAAADASTARWRAGAPMGPLDGVPLVVKDNLRAAGMPAAWGNAALAERPVLADEAPVARLVDAGAIVLAKGNTPEFAVEGFTASALYGVTRNPFDPRLTPGGSSGGVVAALAAGFAHLGVGTDGGGSVRRPAGYCGLFGLKPGIGRVARAGGLPQALLDFEVVGPIARSMRDLALADAVLAGPDPRDPRTLAYPTARPWPAAPRTLYVPSLGGGPVDPEIRVSCRQAADRLADLGCVVEEGPLPLDLDALNDHWPIIGEMGLARLFETDPQVGAKAAPKYREMAARGAAAPATALLRVLELVEQVRREAALMLQDWDIVVTPASAAMPWPADELFPPEIDGVAVGPRGHAVFTGWVNAAGLPGLSLPAAPSAAGLPIGVQLVAAAGAEPLLLALGARYEAATGGFVWPG